MTEQTSAQDKPFIPWEEEWPDLEESEQDEEETFTTLTARLSALPPMPEIEGD